MAYLDNLNISITADASKAVSSVNKLSDSLSKLNTQMGNLNASNLSSIAPGLESLARGMSSLEGLTKTDFNKITAWLGELSKVASDDMRIADVAKLIDALGRSLQTMSGAGESVTSISSLADAVSRLGSANVERAVVAIPNLANALQKLIVTLSQTPAVNSNITKLINAIAQLTSQGQKVGTTARGLEKSLSKTSNSLGNFHLRAFSVSAILGKLYADFWLVIRAVKALGKYVKSAMEYGETLNYFDRAFSDIASKAVSEMEEAGRESAEAYFESFKDRALEINGQLSGITSNGKGFQLFEGKNLGLNANDTLKYQTQFAQISSSMGVASENASILSEVMIKLGGDLGSIKDEDYSTTWKKLSSGLVGMSRTMDAYGVNIRNANLNQTLLDLGIDTTVDKLGQEDKVLLRTITILNSTKYAWGDLSNTINSNANQLRVLQANWQKLSMIIGSMFANALKSLLPIINGVLVALQRLAVFVANLFGIDADFGSSFGSGFEDAYESMGDLADETDKATGSAKKLKNQLLGLDELNVISTQDNSGSGGGFGAGGASMLNDAFLKASEEYLKAWQDAFDAMQDRVTEIADKLWNWLEPLREAFNYIKAGDWYNAGKVLAKFVGSMIEGVSKLMINWVRQGGILKVLKAVTQFVSGWLVGEGQQFYEWGEQIGKPIGERLREMMINSFKTGLKIGDLIGNELIKLKDSYIIIFKALQELGREVAIRVSTWIHDTLLPTLERSFFGAIEILAWVFSKKNIIERLQDIARGFEYIFDIVKDTVVYQKLVDILTLIATTFSLKNILKGLGFVVTAYANIFLKAFNKVVEFTQKTYEFIEKTFTLENVLKAINFVVTAYATVFTNAYNKAKEKADEIVRYLTTKFTHSNVMSYIDGIRAGFNSKMNEVKNSVSTSLEEIANRIREKYPWSSVSGWIDGLRVGFLNVMNAIQRIVETVITAIKNTINSLFGNSNNFNFSGLSNSLTSAISSAVSTAGSKLDELISKLNRVNSGASVTQNAVTTSTNALQQALLNNIDKAVSNTLQPISNTKNLSSTSTLGGHSSAKKYADGGFPQVGSYFWAGEAGPELIGSVGGKTTVASNGEITGISDTIRSTSSSEMQLLRQQNELLMAILNKPTGITESDIFNSVRKSANNYTQMTGNLAF